MCIINLDDDDNENEDDDSSIIRSVDLLAEDYTQENWQQENNHPSSVVVYPWPSAGATDVAVAAVSGIPPSVHVASIPLHISEAKDIYRKIGARADIGNGNKMYKVEMNEFCTSQFGVNRGKMWGTWRRTTQMRVAKYDEWNDDKSTCWVWNYLC